MANIDELKSTGLKATLPRLKILELQLHVVPDQRVQRREGLVHQQYVGIGRQRPR